MLGYFSAHSLLFSVGIAVGAIVRTGVVGANIN